MRPLLPGKIFAYVLDYCISSFQIEVCVYTALLDFLIDLLHRQYIQGVQR